MERINAILDDLIEIKIKQLTKITYDTELNKNGFDRTRQIVTLIEKEIADLNFNEEQRVLYMDRLMHEIMTKDIVLYNQAIYETLPVDVTSDILEWMDRYLLAWEFKQTENLSTLGDRSKGLNISESDFQEAINNNTQIINEIYNYCMSTSAFNFPYQDFLIYISSADFSVPFNDEKKTPKSKLQYTIYALSKIIGNDWYRRSAKRLGLEPKQCSGVTITNDNWKTGIMKIVESKRK